MLQAIRAESELNTNLTDIIGKIESFELAKNLGFSLASANLFYEALASMEEFEEEVQHKFYEFGLWMIRFCEVKYQDLNDRVSILIQFVKNSFWRDVQVKIRYHENYTHEIIVIKTNMDFPDTFVNYYSQTFIAIFEHLGFKKISQSFETSHLKILFEPSSPEIEKLIKYRTVETPEFLLSNDDEKAINRKTLAVDKEIAETLLEISKKRNMTLFNYVNEHILKNCISIESNFDKTIEDIVTEYFIFEGIKAIDLILVPSSIYFESVKTKLFKNPDWTDKWYQEGIKHANLTKIRFSSFPIDEFRQLINHVFFTDVSGFKINFKEENDNLFLSILGTMADVELMTCLARYYEGLFNEYGWILIPEKKIISLGVCSLEFRKK